MTPPEPATSRVWSLAEILIGQCRGCGEISDLPYFREGVGHICEKCFKK